MALGTICAVQPNSRVTVRLLSPRGAEVAARQMVVAAPVDGDTLTFVVIR